MQLFRNFFAKSFVVSNKIYTFAATYSPRFPLEQRAQGESFLCLCISKMKYGRYVIVPANRYQCRIMPVATNIMRYSLKSR